MSRLSTLGVSLAVFVALGGAALLGGSDAVRAADQSVTVGEFWFCSSASQGGTCVTTVTEGDTVTWDFSGASATHTTTGDIWDSGNVNPGGSFSFTFDDAGTYAYQCNIHPTQMMGSIVVEAAAEPPTATSPSADETPGSVAPTATRAASLPPTGQGPSDSPTSWWMFASVVTAAAALSALGALAYARRR
jgi:hypothetical protein